MDLFVANAKNAGQDRKNFLYLNLGLQGGGVQFQRITTDVLATDEEDSWGSGWADFDNDGDLDIIVTNQSAPNTLYRNDGNNNFFRIDEGNIGNNGGDSRGTGWSDYTNDGYVDMLLLNLDSAVENPHNLLYENLKPDPNKWIKIAAIGTVSNRSAIGAKVFVKAAVNGTSVWQMQEISSYTGWGSQNSMQLTFGVGGASSIDSIRVEWPSGITQYLTQITSETSLTITETAANNPPGSFTRLLPVDNQEISRNDVLFSWTEAIDPDGDDVTYELNINVENIDTTFANLADASFTFDFASLPLPTQLLPVTWSVTAFDAAMASTTPTNGNGTFTLDSLITSIGDPFPDAVPGKFALKPNYPNPFNAGTVLSYDVPHTARIRLVIYTVLGQSVRTLVNEEQAPGSYSVQWNGLDDASSPVSSGVYLYRLKTNSEFNATGKMLLLR